MDMTDIIFDVDGTLMNVEKRVQWAKKHKKDTDRVMNWDMFLDPLVMLEFDRPNRDVCSIAKSLGITYSEEGGYENNIIITSARNERHRDVTVRQLQLANVRYDSMYLRDDGDMRPDDVVKAELLGKIITDGFDPTVAFDDRNQVVNKWRELGIHCYQVRTGDF
jgi:phosphoglycolate phosphatase-like HAD superfamily hydrolase|tara:strand:- start:557 stop:1048 length:492 start_codon:yes stop_codon:yes gene_type:complete